MHIACFSLVFQESCSKQYERTVSRGTGANSIPALQGTWLAVRKISNDYRIEYILSKIVGWTSPHATHRIAITPFEDRLPAPASPERFLGDRTSLPTGESCNCSQRAGAPFTRSTCTCNVIWSLQLMFPTIRLLSRYNRSSNRRRCNHLAAISYRSIGFPFLLPSATIRSYVK